MQVYLRCLPWPVLLLCAVTLLLSVAILAACVAAALLQYIGAGTGGGRGAQATPRFLGLITAVEHVTVSSIHVAEHIAYSEAFTRVVGNNV